MNYQERLEDAYAYKSYTFVQDLENEGVNSVKAVACKKQTTLKVSTRYIYIYIYISSKLLINANISLASFIYALTHFLFLMSKPQKFMLLIKPLGTSLSLNDGYRLGFIGIYCN